MRITESQLRKIVREEVLRIKESSYFRSPANAPFDVGAIKKDRATPQEIQSTSDLFKEEYPDFLDAFTEDLARADENDQRMLVMRHLRDLNMKHRLGFGESALLQIGVPLTRMYQDLAERERPIAPWWKK